MKSYTGEPVSVCQKLRVWVDTPDGHQLFLPLVVVAGSGQSILGRDWIRQVQINGRRLNLLDANPHLGKVEELLLLHSEVFSGKLSRLQGVEVKLLVTETMSPKFYRPRQVSYALREKIQELFNLTKARIIEPIHYSKWAALIVPVLKNNGKARICGDCQLTVNQVSKCDTYPIQHIED